MKGGRDALRMGLVGWAVLAGGFVSAAARPVLLPAPRQVEWAAGAGLTEPVTVARWSQTGAGAALAARFRPKLPGGALPTEGYLLQTGPAGALIVAADDLGEIRARQTLRQLPAGSDAVAVADWPDGAWRGIHVLDGGPKSLPLLLRFVHERLAAVKANVFVYEIDYNFRFASHPEIAGEWTRSQVGELVRACRAEGIRLIPQINCLGHQSWKEPPDKLLTAHPEFEEPPNGTDPRTTLGDKEFYCRSWCPMNPKVHPFVCDLVDELLDAFEADAFHAGMDEVFVLASPKCPHCNGLNTADVYAHAVNDLHDHLRKRGAQMLLWGDRLLDEKATGYGEWESSANGTAPALGRIPKDIIVCDWHYDALKSYPSLETFPKAGFRMWPSVWKNAAGAKAFMDAGRARKDPRVLGVLATTWTGADKVAAAALAGADSAAAPSVTATGKADDRSAATTALAVLTDAWCGR